LHEDIGGLRSVTLSADGQLVASGSFDGQVRLWSLSGIANAKDGPAGRPVATLRGHTGTVWALALTADGRLLASGSLDGSISLWETLSARPLVALQGQTGTVWGCGVECRWTGAGQWQHGWDHPALGRPNRACAGGLAGPHGWCALRRALWRRRNAGQWEHGWDDHTLVSRGRA
jgi:hypothetical protein